MANQMIENHLKDVNHVPKFDGTNFREWSYELRLILQQLGLLGLVEARVGHTLPDEIRDNPDDPELITNAAQIDTWILRDVTCRNYIFATLTKPMKEGLYSCDTAAAMWTKLDSQYRLRAAENLHLLWQEFYDFSHQPGMLNFIMHN
ncbi:hypothetical protein DAPPUDRAFT_250138 [Daphnia pulex]|uniref:DUF4219 domain-containing protein n=2 Tax=Daphnia pulex TaxID=6669 RepID=E9GY00_DAPPU|nr:hypothetical protein DAPPUDRAFT_250138 [Daphnia pulex]|eukprot:EFX75512.1 hypothetical protein DAPPUDRAFT_250138 [Daphnia pulex]